VHVERSAVVQAPPATVFAQIDGYRTFNKWSPWYAIDPNAKYSIEGPETGVGAKMSWTGDPKTVGSGSQEIVESVPYERVKTRLDFGGEGTAEAIFTLTPESGGTKVVWGLDTDMGASPIGRYFGLMMDSMVGKDYDKGLERLKTLAEGLPKIDFAGLDIRVVDAKPQTVAYFAATSTQNNEDIAKAIGGAYQEVGKFMAARKLKQASAVLTINNKWDPSGYDFDAAIPVDHAPEEAIPATSKVQVKQTYGGKALRAIHKGAYKGMNVSYEKLQAYMAAYGYEPAGAPWDEYVSDPGRTAEADLVTNIYMPIR
jgi:effector-binding domain-containing protein